MLIFRHLVLSNLQYVMFHYMTKKTTTFLHQRSSESKQIFGSVGLKKKKNINIQYLTLTNTNFLSLDCCKLVIIIQCKNKWINNEKFMTELTSSQVQADQSQAASRIWYWQRAAHTVSTDWPSAFSLRAWLRPYANQRHTGSPQSGEGVYFELGSDRGEMTRLNIRCR